MNAQDFIKTVVAIALVAIAFEMGRNFQVMGAESK